MTSATNAIDSFDKYLNIKLSELWPKRPGGDIGVELELEGSFPKFSSENLTYWTGKAENSLRGGLEFVLRRPVKMGYLSDAMAELSGILKDGSPKKTIRCSTHIHVNVLPKTIRETLTIIGYYYLIENLLVETQGPLRKGNLFCLRLSDAESPINNLCRMVEHRQYFDNFSMGGFKYGALNLAAPARFGSLEFRFFRPMDPPDIERWCRILKDMVDNVPNKTLSDYLGYLRDGDIPSFFSPFTIDQMNFMCQGRSPSQLRDILTDNYMMVHRLKKELERKRKFTIREDLLLAESDTGSNDTPTWHSITEVNGLVFGNGAPEPMIVGDEESEEW